MAWFKKNDPNFVDPEIVNAYLTNPKFLKQSHLQLVDSATLSVEHAADVVDQINVLFETISIKVDVTLLNREEQKALFDVLYYDLPAAILWVATNPTLGYTLMEKFNELHKAVGSACAATLTARERRYRIEGDNLANNFGAIKVLRIYPDPIKEELLRIQEIGRTLKPALNMDKQFVHEAITDHIPTILTLFQDAYTTSPHNEIINEALSQLALVRKHLQEVAERKVVESSTADETERNTPAFLNVSDEVRNELKSHRPADAFWDVGDVTLVETPWMKAIRERKKRKENALKKAAERQDAFTLYHQAELEQKLQQLDDQIEGLHDHIQSRLDDLYRR